MLSLIINQYLSKTGFPSFYKINWIYKLGSVISSTHLSGSYIFSLLCIVVNISYHTPLNWFEIDPVVGLSIIPTKYYFILMNPTLTTCRFLGDNLGILAPYLCSLGSRTYVRHPHTWKLYKVSLTASNLEWYQTSIGYILYQGFGMNLYKQTEWSISIVQRAG